MGVDVRPPEGDRTADDGDYAESTAYRWTERAYELLLSGDLRARAFDSDGVLSSHVWGSCPRCGHALDDRQVHTAVFPGTTRHPGAATGSPPVLEVDVCCACRYPHPLAPPEVAGCGISFRVELLLDGKAA
jgi:hypothetical protein